MKGVAVVDDDARRGEKLLAWFERWPHSTITLRDIQQRAPRPLRKLTNARRIAGILERLACLKRMPEGAGGDGGRPHVWRIVRRGAAFISYDKSASQWRLIWVDQIAQVERALAEAAPRIEAQRPPYGVSAYRWSRYRSEVAHLVECWGHRAATLGLQLEELIGWDGTGWFPSSATRSLAWRLGGLTITHLERDVATCDRVVFHRLPGDQGWQRDVHLNP
jgi:hypothetical protein